MLKSITKRLKPMITAKLNEEYLAISNEANLYCLNYIEARFKRLNIDSGLEFVRPDHISETCTAVSIKIIEIGELLETAYPHLYNNASKNLRVRLRSEVIINDVFKTFGRELFRDGATWAKVAALFAFAASISEDCVLGGRQELVKCVLHCVRMYIHDHLAVWIKNQGGWVSAVLVKIAMLANRKMIKNKNTIMVLVVKNNEHLLEMLLIYLEQRV